MLLTATPMFAAETQQAAKSSTLKTGMYFSKDGRLNINIENNSTRATKVLIKNVSNQIVFQKNTGWHSCISALKLDVNQLPDGEYQVEVSNGEDKVTQKVQLETPKQERVLVVGK